MFYRAAQRGDNGFLKYLATLVAVFIAFIIGQIPLLIVIELSPGKAGRGAAAMEEFQESMDFAVLGISQNLALFLVLLAFVAALGTLYLCIRFLHHKRLADVLTGRRQLDWRRIWFSFGFWFGLSLLLELVGYWLNPENYTLKFDLWLFLPLLVIALFILPLQTTFEEAMFRGYLMQGLGLLFRNRWIPLLATSITFGLLHISNPEIAQFGLALMMPYYIGFGLLMGICTLMDEGTELALGLHAATNIYGATIVSFAGSALQTPTIFRLRELDPIQVLIAAFVSAMLFLLVASRRYGWRDWGKLFRPLPPSTPLPEVESDME